MKFIQLIFFSYTIHIIQFLSSPNTTHIIHLFPALLYVQSTIIIGMSNLFPPLPTLPANEQNLIGFADIWMDVPKRFVATAFEPFQLLVEQTNATTGFICQGRKGVKNSIMIQIQQSASKRWKQQLALFIRDRRLKEAVTKIDTIATSWLDTSISCNAMYAVRDRYLKAKISIMATLIYATTMRKQHSTRAHYAASSRGECMQQPWRFVNLTLEDTTINLQDDITLNQGQVRRPR